MANPQVRLDPDVTELVDGQALEWGSSSRSATVNRMLRDRAAAQVAQELPAPRGAPAEDDRATVAPRAAQGRVGRPSSRSSSKTGVDVAKARAHARASTRGSEKKPQARTSPSSKCRHPSSRRIGDYCAECLQKV